MDCCALAALVLGAEGLVRSLVSGFVRAVADFALGFAGAAFFFGFAGAADFFFLVAVVFLAEVVFFFAPTGFFLGDFAVTFFFAAFFLSFAMLRSVLFYARRPLGPWDAARDAAPESGGNLKRARHVVGPVRVRQPRNLVLRAVELPQMSPRRHDIADAVRGARCSQRGVLGFAGFR